MPTARVMPDGQLNFGYSTIFPYKRIFLTVQGLPWLEATFRITEITNRIEPGSLAFDDTQSFYDRGIDLKIRLVEESEYWPELALGVRDIGGTNLFSSEYLVASRRYYNWDFTGGIAWGNMGSRGHLSNPFADLNNEFGDRAASGTNTAGSFQNSFFKGENIGLFGGVEYQIPDYGVRFKVEYDGNNYEKEPLSNRFEVDSPINFGMEYHPYDWLHLAASWQRGNEAMLRVNLNQSLKEAAAVPKLLDKPAVQLLPRSTTDLIPLTIDNIDQSCGVSDAVNVKLVRIEESTAIFHLNNNCQPDNVAFQREISMLLGGIEGISQYSFYWQGMIKVAHFDAIPTAETLYTILDEKYNQRKVDTDYAILQTEEKLAAALAKGKFQRKCH